MRECSPSAIDLGAHNEPSVGIVLGLASRSALELVRRAEANGLHDLPVASQTRTASIHFNSVSA